MPDSGIPDAYAWARSEKSAANAEEPPCGVNEKKIRNDRPSRNKYICRNCAAGLDGIQ